GVLEDLLEVGVGNAAGDERAHHPEGQLVIGQPRPGGDLLDGKARQILRHVEAAITGQTSQQYVFEIQGRRLAAGTDIAHGINLRSAAPTGRSLRVDTGLVELLDTQADHRRGDAIQRFHGGNGLDDTRLDHAVSHQDHRHQTVLLLGFLLHDRLDVDAALGEDARHLRQHARVILGLDTQIVGALALLDRQDRVIGQRIRLEGQVRHAIGRVGGQCTHHVHQVGHHRRGGRLHAGTGAVVEGAANGVAIDHYRVHHAIDVGDQAVGRNQRRVYAQLDTGFGTTGNAQVLDAITQRLGVVHIGGGQLGDAFGVGLVELQRDAEGDGCQDGQLVGGVDTFDIEGRIGFGVAKCLGFLEHVPEGPALLAHLAEDEVAGAVDDAGQPVDAVGRQTFADRLDDRDAAGNRRFEGDDHALLAGTGEDLVAMHGDQRLVGGNHVLAVVDGLEYQFLGQGVAADQLDDDVDLGVIDQFEDIAGHGNAGGVVLRLGRTNGNLGNLDAATGAPSNLLGIAFEYIQSTATDGAQTTDAHFDRLHTQFPISTARN